MKKYLIFVVGIFVLSEPSIYAAGGSWSHSGNTYYHTGEVIRGMKSGNNFTFVYSIGPPAGWSFATINGGTLKHGLATAIKTFSAGSSNYQISMNGTLTRPGGGSGTVYWQATAEGRTDFYIESNPDPAIISAGSIAIFSAKSNGNPENANWSIIGQNISYTPSPNGVPSINTPTSLAPENYTVNAISSSGIEANATLTIVGVQSISGGGKTSTKENENDLGEDETVYIQVGKSLILTATPAPGSSFPTGTPQWSGNGLNDGNDNSTKEFIITNVEEAGSYIITVACGTSSKKIKIIVMDIVPYAQIDVPGTNRWRTALGVGEETSLSIIPPLSMDEAFSVSDGTLQSSGPETVLISPNRHKSVIVTAKVKGITLTKKLEIVEPDGITLVRQGTGKWHEQGVASCGYLGRFHIMPSHVSFAAIETQEQTAIGTGSDYFASKTGEVHNLGSWNTISSIVVSGTGSKSNAVDIIKSGAYRTTPYTKGEFTWKIDVKFRVGAADSGKVFTTQTHKEVIDSTGKLTISKGNLSDSSELNDPSSSM